MDKRWELLIIWDKKKNFYPKILILPFDLFFFAFFLIFDTIKVK